MSASTHSPAETPGIARTDAADAPETVTLTTPGVALDLPERRTPVARFALVGVLALLTVLLAAAVVAALASTPIGAVLLVAGLLVAPFAIVALLVDGVAVAVERSDALAAAAARNA